jgi:hypothetical protein
MFIGWIDRKPVIVKFLNFQNFKEKEGNVGDTQTVKTTAEIFRKF